MVLLQDQGPRISRHSPTSPLRVHTYREHTVEKIRGSPPPRFGPTKNKAADQPLTAFHSECSPEPPTAHLTSKNAPTRALVGITGKINEAAHRTFRTFSTRPGGNLRTGHSPQNRATLQVAAMILRNHREALREGASISDQFLLSTR